MTLKTTFIRAIAGLAIATVPFATIAPPALAWDNPVEIVPCRTDPHVTYSSVRNQSAAIRFDNDAKTSLTVIVFFDKGRVEVDGRAYRYHFRAGGNCTLKAKIRNDAVYVEAGRATPKTSK